MVDRESRKGLFIDPGDEADRLIDYCTSHKLEPIGILNTHAHLDHIGAVVELKSHFKIPLFLHQLEKPVLEGYEHSCRMFGLPVLPSPEVDHWINGSDQFSIGPFEINYLHTPGHTPGGICFWIGNHVFVGDTLFRGSVGRTDLPGGSWSTLENSLIELLNTLKDSDLIHSGHGPDTNRQSEIVSNPFIRPLLTRINQFS